MDERNPAHVTLKKWEGTVLSRGKDSFRARLIDQNGVGPDEEAEILLTEVSKHDLPLVIPGAIFHWSIGYRMHAGRKERRFSVIRFRRLPAWTEKELQQAKQQAERMRNLFRWNE
jgi:hypothetical protein